MLRFASFTLDLDRLCLRSPSGVVQLRPKAFEVLRYLVENAERVVTKGEVISTVWPGVTVTEEALARCISEIRRALGDEGQQIVKTVAKSGYRIDVPVTSDGPSPPQDRRVLTEDVAPYGLTETPLALRTPAAERRLVTILVCSLVGATGLAAGPSVEVLREIDAAFHRCITEIVERHGGLVGPLLAEDVQAYFGYSHALEDDAERAVRAGLAAVSAVAGIEGLPRKLQARVGIATGLVLVGDVTGDARSLGHVLVGETPHRAARMASRAAPGAVVMSNTTRRIVGNLFECRDLGAGVPQSGVEPLDAFQVLREDTGASRFEALRGPHAFPLVGREQELRFLLHRWEEAKSGNGRVVLLTGEAGIGKSRIALALRERLGGEPCTLLTFHCSPHHQDTALYPIITQLGQAARMRRNDSPEIKLSQLKAFLALSGEWSGEQVAIFASLLSIPGADLLPDLEPQPLKERILNTLMEAVRRLSAVQPLLVVFEDLHWADPTSLEHLQIAVQELRSLPILLIGTARPEFVSPWPNQEHTSMLFLARLSPTDVQALVAHATQGKALPQDVVAQIIARTDGVPLFVEELTKSVLESGCLRDVGDHFELVGPLPGVGVPLTLQVSLGARLDRLPEVKHIAQTAAAIGMEFSYSVLAAVTALPDSDLSAALEQLVAAELIFRRGTPPDATYRFKHSLVRDFAYESLLRDRRQLIEAQIARLLEVRSPRSVAPGQLAAERRLELDGEYQRYSKGMAIREAVGRLGHFSEDDVLEYLRTTSIPDPDVFFDFTYHLAEVCGHFDLAAAALILRSERFLARENMPVASLFAFIAMKASLRAGNRGLLNKSARIFARSSPSDDVSRIVGQLEALSP